MIKLIEDEYSNFTEVELLEKRIYELEKEIDQLKSNLGKVARMAYMGACDLTPSNSATTDFYRIWRELDK